MRNVKSDSLDEGINYGTKDMNRHTLDCDECILLLSFEVTQLDLSDYL